MNPLVKNVFSVVAGVAIGTLVNYGIILLQDKVISLPDEIIPGDMESLKNNIHLLSSKHYIFPFLAHALGTLAGAFTSVKLSTNKHKGFGMGIAAWFLLGGITVAFMLPAPMWFNFLDICLAYLPMGWFGWLLAKDSTTI